MKREEARVLARSLMDASGLADWRFRFDHAKRRAGACTHSTRTISLSGPLTDLYDATTIRGVILHEIAHALVGPDTGTTPRGSGQPEPSARLTPRDCPPPSLPRTRPGWARARAAGPSVASTGRRGASPRAGCARVLSTPR